MRKDLDRFNSIAWLYDGLATLFFGNSILKSQTFNLRLVPEGARVLVLGGGTGRWLKELMAQNATCRIDYVEASSAMLKMARRNNNDHRITFIHGTEKDIPGALYDAVILHYFLDMFKENDLHRVINDIVLTLAPGGTVLVADFVHKKWWHGLLLSAMYLFFRLGGAIDVNALPRWTFIMESRFINTGIAGTFFGEFIESRAYKLGRNG